MSLRDCVSQTRCHEVLGKLMLSIRNYDVSQCRVVSEQILTHDNFNSTRFRILGGQNETYTVLDKSPPRVYL